MHNPPVKRPSLIESSAKDERIIVVDDRMIIASTLNLILQQRGYRSTWFSDPRKALTFARTTPLDLIITDVDMPELCGVDLAIEIAGLNPGCAVLFVSGKLNEDRRFEARSSFDARLFGYCVKPVQVDVLLAEVQRLLRACGAEN